MELSGARLLFFCECWRPADPPAGGAGCVEAGARAFADEGSLILGERTCELVEHASQGGRGVDSFGEATEMHASCSEVVKSANQVCERSSEAVDAHDYEGVSASESSVACAPL